MHTAAITKHLSPFRGMRIRFTVISITFSCLSQQKYTKSVDSKTQKNCLFYEESIRNAASPAGGWRAVAKTLAQFSLQRKQKSKKRKRPRRRQPQKYVPLAIRIL